MPIDPEHPPREAFDRLIRGEASPEETRSIVRHLLVGCLACGRIAEQARRAPVGSPRPEALSYDAVFDRIERKLSRGVVGFMAEQANAQELYAELLGHQAVEGLSQVHSTRRYASLALCELLLRKTRELAL